MRLRDVQGLGRLRERPVGPWRRDVGVFHLDHHWDYFGLRHSLINNDPWNLHVGDVCAIATMERRWNSLVVAGIDVFVLNHLDVPDFLNGVVLLVGVVLVRIGSFGTVGWLLKGTKGRDVNYVP